MLKNDNIVYVVYRWGEKKLGFFETGDDEVSFVSDKNFFLSGVFKDHDRAIKWAKMLTKEHPYGEGDDEEEAYTIIKEHDYFIEIRNDYYKNDEEYSEKIYVIAKELDEHG